MKTLNCNEAKQIPINEYLAKLNIRPVYSKGADLWYLSPLREEKHPSFKVSTKLNAWYDHGTGEGGTIIDLGIRLHNCSIAEFLQLLKTDQLDLSFHQPKTDIHQNRTAAPKIIIEQVSPVKSAALVCYLNSRGISLQTAADYCSEVRFSIGGKNYYAVGFANCSGGYELRNSWFKGSSSPKDISFIDSGSKSICLLEGFIDFLSLLELKRYTQSNVNFLVLNSVSLLSRSISILKSHQNVFLLLNNDKAGKDASIRLEKSNIEGINAGTFYSGFKDINEYLQHLKTARKQEIKLTEKPRNSHRRGLRF